MVGQWDVKPHRDITRYWFITGLIFCFNSLIFQDPSSFSNFHFYGLHQQYTVKWIIHMWTRGSNDCCSSFFVCWCFVITFSSCTWMETDAKWCVKYLWKSRFVPTNIFITVGVGLLGSDWLSGTKSSACQVKLPQKKEQAPNLWIVHSRNSVNTLRWTCHAAVMSSDSSCCALTIFVKNGNTYSTYVATSPCSLNMAAGLVWMVQPSIKAFKKDKKRYNMDF